MIECAWPAGQSWRRNSVPRKTATAVPVWFDFAAGVSPSSLLFFLESFFPLVTLLDLLAYSSLPVANPRDGLMDEVTFVAAYLHKSST